jgi:hypothetical protein
VPQERLSDVQGYGEYFIGYFDILGFKDTVKTCFEKDDSRLDRTVTRVLDTLPKGFISTFNNSNKYKAPQENDQDDIVQAFFSDSIFFILKKGRDLETNQSKFMKLCNLMDAYLRQLLIHFTDNSHFQAPLRGAIASGKAVVKPESKIFYGPAINDAVELAESQNWAGAAIHGSVQLELLFKNDINEVVGFDKLLYEYPAIPLDKNRNRYGSDVKYALNWVRVHTANTTFYRFIEKDKPLARDVVYHIAKAGWKGHSEKKNNTILFAVSICQDFADSKSESYFDSYSKGQSHYLEGAYDQTGLSDVLRSSSIE